MKLTIKDRLQVNTILVKSSTIVEQLVCRSILEKTTIKAHEISECEIKDLPNGGVIWSKEKDIEVSFTKEEIEVLKKSVKILEDSESVTQENLDLCIKIKRCQ